MCHSELLRFKAFGKKVRFIFANLGIQNTDIQGWFVIPNLLYYELGEIHPLQKAISFLQDSSHESPHEVTRFLLKAVKTNFDSQI